MDVTVVTVGTLKMCKALVKSPSSEYKYSVFTGRFSLQCFDTVGWVTGRAFGL